MAQATDLERLVVQLEAQSTKLDKALDKITGDVDRKLNQVERRTAVFSQRVSDGFGRAGQIIAGYFSVRAIGAFIAKISESADNLSALSERTGISVEQLQKLGAAGRAFNVETSQLNEGLDAFVQRLGAAQQGQGDLAKVMRDHGIAAGSDYVQTLLAVADAVQKSKSRAEEYRIVTAAMGRSSVELVGFFRQGSAAIKEQMDAFKGGLSTETVRNLAEFNQHWKEISVSFTNMAAGPATTVLEGLSRFLHDLESGGWEQKLATLANFLTFSMPARVLGSSPAQEVERLQSLLKGLERRATETRGAVRAAVLAQIQSVKGDLSAAANAAFSHNVGVDRGALAGVNKPLGGDVGDAEAAAKEIAKLLSDLRASQAQLAQATSAANAAALKDTDAYYDEVRRGAKEAADAEILSIDERKKADIAAIDEKIGRGEDYRKIVNIIEQKAAADEATVFEKRRQTLENINQEEINDRRAAAERLQSIEEQRALTLQRTNEAAIASGADLVRAQNGLALERARGTQAYFDVSRRMIDDDLALQKGAIKAREETEIASLAKLREERFKAGADGVSVWQQYEQAVGDLHQQTTDEIAAADADAAAKRIQLTEDETHALENQIAVMDRVRGGLEDVAAAGVHGLKDLKSAAVQFIEQLAEMALRLYVIRPLIEGAFGRAGTTGGGLLGSLFGLGGGGVGAGDIDMTDIPGRARGGSVSAGMPYWVGERGRRELFIPDVPGSIVPDDRALAVASLPASNGMGVTIVNHNSFAGAVNAQSMMAYADQAAARNAAAVAQHFQRTFPGQLVRVQKRNF